MNVEEKIIEFLKEQNVINNLKLSKIKITEEKNKNNENILYIRTSNFEEKVGVNYSSYAIYYAFNQSGDYVGYVRINILNVIPPSKVEMEYCANPKFKNQGNILILAKEVLKEIFEEKVFNDVKVRDTKSVSNINSVMVYINRNNYPSLAVAKKLGFNNLGYLEKNEYFASKKI